jgi:hypothetical protein
LVELSSSGTSRHPAAGKRGLIDDGDTVFEGILFACNIQRIECITLHGFLP